MKEKTQIYCHGCGGYINIELDMSLNGNHVVKCPKCKHEHCRVIENGRITGDRWSQRNGYATYNYQATTSNYSTISHDDTVSGSNQYTNDLWVRSTGNYAYVTTSLATATC